ncbi:AMP-binding protein [Pantoea dispersa]|uniref:AMP-binding protein n=1 Tax=Pantoea dispersa TaxID=59814 RepID=UPI001BA67078|nr:AMP-binding protein [Pantoea dispersa]MBS0899811.1 AMP-binding protein [Pantoea dispersa]MBS0907643.1 AMP-binding protein [Pantoea dispersa]
MNLYDHKIAFAERQEKISAICGSTFHDYDHFARSVPISKKLRTNGGEQQQNDVNGARMPALIGATSGSSGKMKPVRIQLKNGGNSISASERNFIYRLRERQVISSHDVVGNLFTINLFSTLHQSASDIIRYCQGSIVPIGDIALLSRDHFLFLQDTGINVLFGVPATIIQFVEAMLAAAVPLNIEKVVFTGEKLRPVQARWLHSRLGPTLSIVGLYGLSECGFLGLMNHQTFDEYTLFNDDFFFEQDPLHGLLVTSLDPCTNNRLIRYPTGDGVELAYHNPQLHMRILARKDLMFNFIGNLISVESIAATVAESLPESSIQLVIRSENDQQELLLLNVAGENLQMQQIQRIAQQLRARPEFAEAYQKQRGRVEVQMVAENAFILSSRGKHQFIVDERE